EAKKKNNETKEIQAEVPAQSLFQEEELGKKQNVTINESNSSEKLQDTSAERDQMETLQEQSELVVTDELALKEYSPLLSHMQIG
ncbi:27556_t:CDS:2, partial [Gigaspora margarita]